MAVPPWLPLLGALPAVGLALLGFAAHDSGAFEKVPCGRVVAYNTKNADLGDRYIEGYVAVGFDFGVTIQQAASALDSVDAHWSFDYPYHRAAAVCTRPGEEEKWENLLVEVEGVQFVHREGVRPLAIED